MRVGLTFGTKNPAWSTKIEPYLAALRKVDLEPVLVLPDTRRAAGELAGWVIGGGTDIDPALYGEGRHAESEDPDRPRDAMESAILREALDLDLPVLAICRGMQMMNVVQGGTLEQHIEGHRLPGVADAHGVRLVQDSRLAALAGSLQYNINSRHHQAVARLGRDLRMTGYASHDGTIEALEHTVARFAVAVQWHPEDRMESSVEDLRLFRAFARACVGGTIEA